MEHPGRDVYVEQLLALLDARGAPLTPHALVFASRTGGGLERKVARSALQRAARQAQLQRPHPTLHDLRHSHASMLIALDFSVVDVQRRLGHRKPDTTLRVYAHEWKYREAQRSTIGRQLDRMLYSASKALPRADTRRIALTPTET
jgi:integrase